MLLPEKIYIKIIDKNNKKIEGLCLSLCFLTKYKNPYYIILTQSNIFNGVYMITQKEILEDANNTMRLFPMDYVNLQETFTGEVEITLEKDFDNLLEAYLLWSHSGVKYPKNFVSDIKYAKKIMGILIKEGRFDGLRFELKSFPKESVYFKIVNKE